jgi:hypothetical protein
MFLFFLMENLVLFVSPIRMMSRSLNSACWGVIQPTNSGLGTTWVNEASN